MMLYSEEKHAQIMKKLEELTEILKNDPEKRKKFMFDAGVRDEHGNMT